MVTIREALEANLTWDEVEGKHEGPAVPFVPGLVGSLTDWTVRTARTPNPGLSLSTGIATVMKFADRHVAGPTDSGTHLYLLMLATTGVGKQHAQEAIKAFLTVAGLSELIGPGDLASVQALQRLITKKPSVLCILDEFGLFLKRILADKSPHTQGIVRETNQLYGISFGRYDGCATAHDDAAIVNAPALGLAGYGTPEQYYSSLQDSYLGNGYLNRWTNMLASLRTVVQRTSAHLLDMPAELIKEIKAVVAFASAGGSFDQSFGELRPKRRLEWGSLGAGDMYWDLVRAMEQGDEEAQELQVRVAEMAVRLATIRAVGQCAKVVNLDDMEWGRMLALESLATLRDGLERWHRPNLDFPALCRKIAEKVEKEGWVKVRDIKRSFGQNVQRKQYIKDAIEQLKEEERVEVEWRTPANGGRSSEGLRWLG